MEVVSMGLRRRVRIVRKISMMVLSYSGIDVVIVKDRWSIKGCR